MCFLIFCFILLFLPCSTFEYMTCKCYVMLICLSLWLRQLVSCCDIHIGNSVRVFLIHIMFPCYILVTGSLVVVVVMMSSVPTYFSIPFCAAMYIQFRVSLFSPSSPIPYIYLDLYILKCLYLMTCSA